MLMSHYTCPKCRGNGVITETTVDQNGRVIVRVVDCPKCGGLGLIHVPKQYYPIPEILEYLEAE